MKPPDSVPRLLLTTPQAAEALQISPRTLWALTARGEIPVVRIGRSVRYPASALRTFVEARQTAQGVTHDR